jgi:predicted DNA-binding antitoxin AbrB/MazE fold protein
MNAIKKIIEVEKDKSIMLKSLPFKPGSKVEVIVLPVAEGKKDIFDFMDTVVRKRRISPLSLKQVEKIVHEVRSRR